MWGGIGIWGFPFGGVYMGLYCDFVGVAFCRVYLGLYRARCIGFGKSSSQNAMVGRDSS